MEAKVELEIEQKCLNAVGLPMDWAACVWDADARRLCEPTTFELGELDEVACSVPCFYVGATVSPSWRMNGGENARWHMPGHMAQGWRKMTVVCCRLGHAARDLEVILINYGLNKYGDRCANKARDSRGFRCGADEPGFVYVSCFLFAEADLAIRRIGSRC